MHFPVNGSSLFRIINFKELVANGLKIDIDDVIDDWLSIDFFDLSSLRDSGCI